MQRRNVEGIKKFSEQKTVEAYRKAVSAIERLRKEKLKINFNTVSIEAGVSKPFLYTHPELRDKIERLRRPEPTETDGTCRLTHQLEEENNNLRKEVRRLQEILRKSKISIIV
ncbi:DUF6262 family protein [Paenibacillus sp. MZ04-78.2]|uniref:DUF6262 family protein n=1 Tax=Paenibacillus sp. MZ04-78.2 TaxID=2962034 RepID=UPI0020B8EF40|nr:DUF6262 family protein [Paenibacillus sp. MZ04-78.2]MCP3774078.1 DUF6262 family protein [Paenibacillus sp. MZ04-78.2]